LFPKKLLKEIHGFGTPIPRLLPDMNDSIFPSEENTYKLINRYIRLGGSVTVYSSIIGKQSLQGYHFPIDNKKAVVDSILNSQL